METKDYLSFLVNEIHSTVFATVDRQGNPVTCAIDLMDCNEDSLYFLTARGKAFYKRLKENDRIALTGMKGSDTLSCTSVSVRGRAEEIGPDRLGRLFAKNPYMEKIYPSEASREVLTVFRIVEGTGEWFDLSKLPIERDSFVFGGGIKEEWGYRITGSCTGCGRCQEKCPQSCIDVSVLPAVINQKSCIHCGNCFTGCPEGAVVKSGGEKGVREEGGL